MTDTKALAVIEGSLPDKMLAFRSIAAITASGLWPGYEDPQRAMIACWSADALQVHPATFMQNVHAFSPGGKLMLEPKWEFICALLRARLPGFDYEVIEESETACEIVYSARGRKDQRVRYTMEDAVRQGLAGPQGRNRDTYAKNNKEMLWKQNWKRGGDRIGGDVLFGLPTGRNFEEEPEHEPSTAEVLGDEELTHARGMRREEARVEHVAEGVRAAVDEAVEDGAGRESTPRVAGSAGAVEVRETRETGTVTDWHAALTLELDRVYGKLRKDAKLAKCSFLMYEATGVQTVLRKANEIGADTAKALVTILRKLPSFAQAGGGAVTDAAAKEGAPALPQDDLLAGMTDEQLAAAALDGVAEAVASAPVAKPAPPYEEMFYAAAQAVGMSTPEIVKIVGLATPEGSRAPNYERAYAMLEEEHRKAVAS